MRIECGQAIISDDELKALVLGFAAEYADRGNPARVWFVYDSDGGSDVLAGTVASFHGYHDACSEYGRRLDEDDWSCRGFLAAPHFSSYSV